MYVQTYTHTRACIHTPYLSAILDLTEYEHMRASIHTPYLSAILAMKAEIEAAAEHASSWQRL
jgi:hypothetical protein